MKHYEINDFINPVTEPAEVCAEKKISLLYDLCILTVTYGQGKRLRKDPREHALREVLSHYCSETEINNALHDIVYGNKTLDQFLAQKGAETEANEGGEPQ
jgi:hypothetical protein